MAPLVEGKIRAEKAAPGIICYRALKMIWSAIAIVRFVAVGIISFLSIYF